MKPLIERKLDFDDVLIVPQRSSLDSREKVELHRKFKFKNAEWDAEWQGIPIIASNMSSVATWSMAEILSLNGMMTFMHKYIPVEEWDFVHEKNPNMLTEFTNIYPTIGMSNQDFDKLGQILDLNCEVGGVCLDVANGYIEKFLKYVEMVRKEYPFLIIFAGNVVTTGMTEALIQAGADVVKIGIGSGSACTTRIKTGVGYPQLSAIMECAYVAHGLGAQIISDGGCRTAGDVCKAFAAGADFVMLGGMLAGHDECELKTVDASTFHKDFKGVPFYGMSSEKAQKVHSNGVSNYATSEGRELLVPYKGPVQGTLSDILGGLRSCCTYVGARRLKDLTKCATFIQVNHQYNKVFEGE